VDLVQRADIAMYEAKTSHEGVVRYEASLDRYELTNLGLLTELRNAIPAGELVLHFQPKTSLPDGRVNSVEALVRWQHPTKGLLAPGAFLPLAERTDVIFDLTRWVLAEALGYLAELPADVSVAVNVSARSLASASFAQSVIDAIENAGAAAERLILEVTETALLTDPARAAEILGALDARGVRVSLDDFGSGQTSLGYLSTLPLRELKIDMSFIRDMLDNPAHAAIVTSIVELGHNLSLRVVGEGVESGPVLAQLTSTGCDEAQGYFLARPMPAAQLDEWFTAREDDPRLQPELR
jgi:EAL domain-containing protein (putative c-di-GMP-specific phosphodiesterase class I)